MKVLIVLFTLIIINIIVCEKLVNEENQNQLLSVSLLNHLNVQDVKFAQTHVIPAEGKKWNIKNKEHVLKLIGGRSALLLARFDDHQHQETILVRVWGGGKECTIKMNLPSQLPATEDNGPKYSIVHHSCIIPGEWIKSDRDQKMQFKIQFESTTNTAMKSKIIIPNVGQERVLVLWTLPIYLFGANDKNSVQFSKVRKVDSSVVTELVQKWSVTNIESNNHPLGKINWPYFIVPPRNGYRAMKITSSSQKKDTFEIMDQILLILKGIRVAWGETSSSNLIYSPLLQLDSEGIYEDPYSGLGCVGGSVSTGDYFYTGVFIHEIGHSFGLHHAGSQFNKGEYPYSKGSLKGSEYGYDLNKNEFLSIYIPRSSISYRDCQKYYLVSNDGHCFKNTIMQDGDGNQASNYKYSMFSDYEMVTIQNYFEKSIYYNSGNKKYMKFNPISNQYYNYTPRTKEYGLYGIINEGIPIERDVQVYTIVLTYSTIGPSELSQFYPIIKSRGNLIQYFDPTNQTDIKNINPTSNSSLYPWYCYESGCDYTVRVTFSDESIKYILLPKGKRKWWMPTRNMYLDGLYNPYSLDSFLLFVLNVKASDGISIKKLELLDTPFGFNGISNNHNSHKIIISHLI